MVPPAIPTRLRAVYGFALGGAMLVMCAGLLTAAILMHPPIGAMPVILLVGLALPMLAGYELLSAVVALRFTRQDAMGRRHVVRLRRQLRDLPETHHPLGH